MMTKEEMPACPVATTVALIGSKWKLLIIRNLRQRPWRFNELKKDLQGVSQKGPHRQPAQFGGGRGHRPHRLPRGAAPGGVRPQRPGQLHAPHPGLHGAVGEGLSEAGPGRVTRENEQAGRAPLAYPRVFSLLAFAYPALGPEAVLESNRRPRPWPWAPFCVFTGLSKGPRAAGRGRPAAGGRPPRGA